MVDHTTSFLSLCSGGGEVANRALPFAQVRKPTICSAMVLESPEPLFVVSGEAGVEIGLSRPTSDDPQGFLQELRCLLAVGALEPHGVDGDFPRGGDDDFDCWFHCSLVSERRTRSNWNSVSDQSRAWMADFNRSMRTSVIAIVPL